MTSHVKFDKAPSAEPFDRDYCQLFCEKTRFPAIYYEIDVFCGTKKHTCLRRYSQFLQLCNKFDPSGKLGVKSKLPPKTGPFYEATHDFLENRKHMLHEFLKELLTRKEAVANPFVEQFLELDVLQ